MKYIRFGEIPDNEKSGIYRGEEKIGEEQGVSVYLAVQQPNGGYGIGLSLPITKDTLDTFRQLVEYSNRECYLVEGDFIGTDCDNQPLIKNVKVLSTIAWRVNDGYSVTTSHDNSNNPNNV